MTTHDDITYAARLMRETAAAERTMATLDRAIQGAEFAARSAETAWSDRLNFRLAPERLAGITDLYRRSDAQKRRMIVFSYQSLLRAFASNPADLGPLVDFHALPQAARPYVLAPYLKLAIGGAYPELDLTASDPERGRLTYTHTGGPADPALWQPHLAAIRSWLGANWQITAHTATTITLSQRPELPKIIPMQVEYLRPGALFCGIDVATQQPGYIPISDMTSGTFIPGAAGTGKSNALHILLLSLFANLDLFTHVYLVDGKDGVAFDRYSGKHPKVSVLWDEPDLWSLTTELVATMRARNADQRAIGIDNAKRDFIAVVIDEMSTYTAKPSSDAKSDANKAHVRFLDELAMLARRGRSTGLRLIITAQEPTDNQIPTSVRANCQTTLAFGLPVDAHAITTFGQLDGLPADPRKLTRGRALLKQSMTGDIRHVQFPVTEPPRGAA